MTPALRRLIALSVGATLAIAVVGVGVEVLRFGMNEAATAARLESEVRRRFAYSTRRVESLARSVAEEGERVRAAEQSDAGLPALFARLSELSSPVGLAGTSATVHLLEPRPDGHRILAWSDGPAGEIGPDRLTGPRALFVAPGTAGLRLVAVHPIEWDGRRIGTASAELVLAPIVRPGACTGTLETSYGPAVATAPACGGAGAAQELEDGFLIATETGAPMLEVRFVAEQFWEPRREYRRRLAAITALPLLLLGLLATGPVMMRRNRAATIPAWLGWTLATSGAMVGMALVAAGLASLVGLADVLTPAIAGLAGLGLAALIAGGWWWRPVRRRPWLETSVWFTLEHLTAGLLVVATLWSLSRLVEGRITAGSIDIWQFPLLPFNAAALFYLVGILLTQIAVCWTMAVMLGVLADRWRFGTRRPWRVLLAVSLWLAPAAAVLVMFGRSRSFEPGPWLALAAALATFGLLASTLRRIYRHSTLSARLVLLFAALVGPPLATYPMSAAAADQAVRELIETEFAPAILDQPEALQAALAQAQRDVDALPRLAALVAAGPALAPGEVESQSAYAVWNQTVLARSRMTSEIELFGPGGQLVSRFALNVPELPYGEAGPVWTSRNCEWDVFGEAARFGAEERIMLHAERAICGALGELQGAIVIHAVSDYRSLPFVATVSPYAQALRETGERRPSERLAGLEVVVYGWNDDPQFISGRTAWPIDELVSSRLYASREPFWTRQMAGDREYAVYFVNDRRGFYALGYPLPAFIEHATRLAEITALVGALLLLLLGGATAYAPVLRGHRAPLPVLFHEIRTSYYRKLFLFFVLAAVGPVILLALAFGAHTATRIRADVESEAAGAVTVTRRLFEEFTALEQASLDGATRATDEQWMVIIRQMTTQDANLYEGPRLVATSQRDLFDSGLLPMRTPASVYRRIALERQPTYVGVDRIGALEYLVAAAPVPSRGRDVLISVPLATRQREIEREIDELNRRVLVGAVVVVLFAAGLGAAVAGRVADPVSRLSRAARQIAAGRLDVRIVADTADELRRLVDDFNTMTERLAAHREELERTHQLKAWAQMARQVAHEIKNPLTPIQLAAEHLQRVHQDRDRPLGAVFDQCLTTVLQQVRLLRQIASEFSNFAVELTPRLERVDVAGLVDGIVGPYRLGLTDRVQLEVDCPDAVPEVWADRTLIARALTNLIENALQAMPDGGRLRVAVAAAGGMVGISVADTGVGMDAEAAKRAFEPYFSTKTGGSGLGLPNARRYAELCGGEMTLDTRPGRGTVVTVTLPEAPPDEPEAV